MKTANRIFAILFFVIVGIWVVWQPIMWDIQGQEPVFPEWYCGYLMYGFLMIGYPIILVGLAYEIYRPSLDLEWDKNWKWISTGVFLLIVAATIITVDMIWLPFDPEYSLFEQTQFEFPRRSGQIHIWPNYLLSFLEVFCMETTSFSLMFGLLFMTKSTPQRSKSYKIMLIGAIAFEAILCMLTYFLFFILDMPVGPYTGISKIELLTSHWFHWDFWSELVILLGAFRLLAKGKK